MYYTVHSPSITERSKPSEPYDPTAKAVYRIVELDKQIEMFTQQYNDIAVEVLDWLYDETTTAEMRKPSQFRSIIICRYLRGMSWEETARKALKVSGVETARRRVYRYFQDHPEG